MAKSIKKNSNSSTQLIPAGNVPPSAPEVEQAVLGAMLIEKEAIAKAISILNTESFYKREHQLIYEAMISLFESGEPVDVVTVYEELKKRNQIEQVGGAAYISFLSQNIASAALIETHARIVVEKQILRSLIQSAHQIAKDAYDGNQDAFEILDEAERKIFEISELQMKRNYQGMDVAVKNAIEYIEAIHTQTHRDFAVPTGFYELDEILGGFQKSDLIIIAARPSMGKTAFALTLARNAAIDHKVP
ncbi:DnaB-like helicase N-terminal domain-containing protein, partial [Ignavibacterium album]|uniref:replicative DNA helicase n=1 Tax=Ignavibacterium album TaxID=591197 RepID=UPI0026EC3C06